MSGILCSFIAFVANSYVSKNLIGYGFFEQLKDVIPSILLSLIMGGLVFFLGKIKMNLYFVFIIQVLAGMLIYILLSFISKNSEFSFIYCIFRKRVKSLL